MGSFQERGGGGGTAILLATVLLQLHLVTLKPSTTSTWKSFNKTNQSKRPSNQTKKKMKTEINTTQEQTKYEDRKTKIVNCEICSSHYYSKRKIQNVLSNYKIGKFSQSEYPKCKADIASIQ